MEIVEKGRQVLYNVHDGDDDKGSGEYQYAHSDVGIYIFMTDSKSNPNC